MTEAAQKAETPEDLEQEELATALVASIFTNLSTIVDQEIRVETSESSESETPPAGPGCIHISFRFAIRSADKQRFACLLLPLEQVVAGACSMMMMPLDQVGEICESGTLDSTMKDAILEIGNMLSNAFTKVFTETGRKESVGFHGCQGLRADGIAWIPANNPEGWENLAGQGNWEDVGEFSFALGLPRL